MPVADLQLPTRLLAGGGPSSPHQRVLHALSTPLIGQFDPDFTAIMDDVMQLAREVFVTANPRTYAVSGTASAGLEAVLNSLLEEDDEGVAIDGSPPFTEQVSELARGCGGRILVPGEERAQPKLMVVPFVDPMSGRLFPVAKIAATCHSRGVRLVVDATCGLAARELRVDDWGIDVCVAGVDHAVGAPAGMALLTYSAEIETILAARRAAPRTSFLDLLQLQAYWSPERLNHHTAPTSLIYALREALRLIYEEGLSERWQRHMDVGQALRDGLVALGLEVGGELPWSIVQLPAHVAPGALRRRLLEDFGVSVAQVGSHALRFGLLAADARAEAVNLTLAALQKVLVAR